MILKQDVSQVEKYMMSDEDYGKRKNTFRAYKAAQIANDPTWKSIFAQRADAAQVLLDAPAYVLQYS